MVIILAGAQARYRAAAYDWDTMAKLGKEAAQIVTANKPWDRPRCLAAKHPLEQARLADHRVEGLVENDSVDLVIGDGH